MRENLTTIQIPIKAAKVHGINSSTTVYADCRAFASSELLTYVCFEQGYQNRYPNCGTRNLWVTRSRQEVTLNAIQLPSIKDWKKSVRRSLWRWEAFGKSRKKMKKFQVNTPQFSVAVLGTSSTFIRGPSFYVQCYEGLVSVNFNGNDIKSSCGSYAQIENNQPCTYRADKRHLHGLILKVPFQLSWKRS